MLAFEIFLYNFAKSVITANGTRSRNTTQILNLYILNISNLGNFYLMHLVELRVKLAQRLQIE